MKKIISVFASAVLILTMMIPLTFSASAESNSYNDLKFGVISDIHVHDGTTGVDTHLVTILNYYKQQNVDAILVLGDVANSGLDSQYQKFNQIWASVFPENDDAAPARLILMGNHEFQQAYYHNETVEEAQQRYMNAYGYNTLNFNRVIGGYHFIGLNSEGSAVHGKYTSQTTDWLKAQLDAAVLEDPNAPIFVSCHQTLANTTYGSSWGSSNTGMIYNLLKDYPQVVYFAGHSHRATENERCIWQGDFTCIDCPSLQYLHLEPNYAPSDAYSINGALMVTIDGSTSSMTVNRKRIDQNTSPESVREAKSPWVLSLPLSTNTFTYTDDRVYSRTAPVFAANAEITVSDVTNNSFNIAFPSAAHNDFVQRYNITVTNNETGVKEISDFYVTDFYRDYTNMNPTQTYAAAGLASNTEYTVSVTAEESFGLKSEPLTATVVTDVTDDVYSYYYEIYSYTTSNGEHPILFNETEGVSFASENIKSSYDILGGDYYFFAQRNDGNQSGYLEYTFDGKYVTSLTVDVLLLDAFVNNYSAPYIVKMQAVTEEGETVDVDTEFLSRTEIGDNIGWSTAKITNKGSFPAKTNVVRIVLAPQAENGFKAGGVGYTIRLDDARFMLINSNVIMDELSDTSLLFSSNNVKIHTENINSISYKGAVKEDNALSATMVYSVEEGKRITAFKADLLVMNAFFSNYAKILSVSAIANGVMTPLTLRFDENGLLKDNGNYSIYSHTISCADLPEGTTSIVITLDPQNTGYANWTAIVDTVYLFTEGETVFVGDANGDGLVNIRDLVNLKKHLSGIYDSVQGCDFDQNGIIDSRDIISLRKLILDI